MHLAVEIDVARRMQHLCSATSTLLLNAMPALRIIGKVDVRTGIGKPVAIPAEYDMAELHSRLAALSRTYAIVEYDPQGLLTATNENFVKIISFHSFHEMRGSHHSEFLDSGNGTSDEVYAQWERLKQGHFVSGVYKKITRRGDTIWLQSSLSAIYDSHGAVCRIVECGTDVTRQVVHASSSVGRLRALDKSQAVIESSPDGTIITANRNYCKAMGYHLDEIQGRHHRLFCEPSSAYKEFWAKLKRGEYVSGEFKRINRSGDTVFIEASYNHLFDVDGKVTSIVKYATDVTKRRLAELHTADLEARARSSAQASELKSAFVATVSHELRTPLGGILGLCEILRSEANTKFLLDHIDQVRDCAEGLFFNCQQYTGFIQSRGRENGF